MGLSDKSEKLALPLSVFANQRAMGFIVSSIDNVNLDGLAI
ncbi:MAG: hypothetical protein U0586_01860 [Candidatus Brocadiaceae bacterium]